MQSGGRIGELDVRPADFEVFAKSRTKSSNGISELASALINHTMLSTNLLQYFSQRLFRAS